MWRMLQGEPPRDYVIATGKTVSLETFVGKAFAHFSLDGHTDRSPYGNSERGYSNWELSSDRANSSRRELAAAGMPDDKLARVTGLAASSLLEVKNPLAPTNRRISILVMTREAEERLLGNRAPMAPAADASTPSAAAQPP